MVEKALLATDIVVFNGSHVLLIKRKNPPWQGYYALPGGLVNKDETVIDAAKRELEEETGVKATDLKEIDVYSTPGRDPRGRVVSFAFTTKVNNPEPELKAADDALEAKWFPTEKLPELAFDHKEIIKDALKIKDNNNSNNNNNIT